MTGGAVAGAVIGTLAGAGLLLTTALFLFTRAKRRRLSDRSHPYGASMAEMGNDGGFPAGGKLHELSTDGTLVFKGAGEIKVTEETVKLPGAEHRSAPGSPTGTEEH